MITIDSDTLVNVVGLFDSVSQTYVTDATVTATVLDPNTGGTAIGPVSLTGGVGGNYSGTLTAAQTNALSQGGTYVLQVQAVTTGGATLTDRSVHRAVYFSG